LFGFVCIIIPEKASFSLHFNGLQLLSRFYLYKFCSIPRGAPFFERKQARPVNRMRDKGF
ncbi:hypothetical protein, partial [Thiolapillus sp.]|uniref:hypothetical protein n=1 Tax=Thiolapillus sp. TaxID=2017437 RepID=UPI003AF691B0